jgi:hypothetical protein
MSSCSIARLSPQRSPHSKHAALLSQAELRERVERWASIEHGSASPGERAVANLLADELRGLGLPVRIEEEEVHGTYWWPVGLPTALAAAAGLAGRLPGAVAGLFAAKAVADDISCTNQWFRRRFLPKRTTHNVVAEAGAAGAARTLVFVAHHDAPHAGLVFNPAAPRAWPDRLPWLFRRVNTSPPIMWGSFFGPLFVALGSMFGLRRLRLFGSLLSAGYAAAMTDIGVRSVVPGANDNLSAVAAQMSLARALAADAPEATRVILLFTGSEESFQEGMQAWARRHFDALPRATTTFVALETVGSPHLLVLEGEGMLGVYDYPEDFKALIKDVAAEEGIDLFPGLRVRNASDGLIPLKAGYRSAMLGSVDRFKAPTNYHWYTDVPENVDYGTVDECARLCLALTRRLEEGRPA